MGFAGGCLEDRVFGSLGCLARTRRCRLVVWSGRAVILVGQSPADEMEVAPGGGFGGQSPPYERERARVLGRAHPTNSLWFVVLAGGERAMGVEWRLGFYFGAGTSDKGPMVMVAVRVRG